MEGKKNFKYKLGMFILVGLTLFIIGIYYIGKNRNLFSDTFTLKAVFHNVGGLQVGNNIRFSGINVGTVDGIEIINDTSVMVKILLEERVRPFIKVNSSAVIGSSGKEGRKNQVITILSNASNSPSRITMVSNVIPGKP